MSSENKNKPKIITISDAKEILEKLAPEKTDQIQKRTLDYAIKFSKTDVKNAKENAEKLVKECNLTRDEAVEIVNIMPKSVEEIRVHASGWRKLIPTETLEKILDILGSN